jgi:hypothetical protein
MVKKTITYTDYDGNERTEDFYFNLTQAELVEMEYSTDGGMRNKLQKAINEVDPRKLMTIFKDIVIKAYGIKSDDGKRFIKNDKVREEFMESEAYSMIFMELVTDTKAAEDFINNIIPKVATTRPNPIPAKNL